MCRGAGMGEPTNSTLHNLSLNGALPTLWPMALFIRFWPQIRQNREPTLIDIIFDDYIKQNQGPTFIVLILDDHIRQNGEPTFIDLSWRTHQTKSRVKIYRIHLWWPHQKKNGKPKLIDFTLATSGRTEGQSLSYSSLITALGKIESLCSSTSSLTTTFKRPWLRFKLHVYHPLLPYEGVGWKHMCSIDYCLDHARRI